MLIARVIVFPLVVRFMPSKAVAKIPISAFSCRFIWTMLETKRTTSDRDWASFSERVSAWNDIEI